MRWISAVSALVAALTLGGQSQAQDFSADLAALQNAAGNPRKKRGQ